MPTEYIGTSPSMFQWVPMKRPMCLRVETPVIWVFSSGLAAPEPRRKASAGRCRQGGRRVADLFHTCATSFCACHTGLRGCRHYYRSDPSSPTSSLNSYPSSGKRSGPPVISTCLSSELYFFITRTPITSPTPSVRRRLCLHQPPPLVLGTAPRIAILQTQNTDLLLNPRYSRLRSCHVGCTVLSKWPAAAAPGLPRLRAASVPPAGMSRSSLVRFFPVPRFADLTR